MIGRTAAAVVRRRDLRDDPLLDEARRRIEQLNAEDV
jgi:hypothetical protein